MTVRVAEALMQSMNSGGSTVAVNNVTPSGNPLPDGTEGRNLTHVH